MTWDRGHGNERILKISDLQETFEVVQSSQKGLTREKKECQFCRNNKEINNKESGYVSVPGRRQRGIRECRGFCFFCFPMTVIYVEVALWTSRPNKSLLRMPESTEFGDFMATKITLGGGALLMIRTRLIPSLSISFSWMSSLGRLLLFLFCTEWQRIPLCSQLCQARIKPFLPLVFLLACPPTESLPH